MGVFLLLVSLLSIKAFAILPLPYPLDPADEDPPQWQENWNPKNVQGYSDLLTGGKLREMELPVFQNSGETIGHDDTFIVPSELKTRVEFWKRIYSEYTSSQAVLHDYDNPEILYGVVDISKFTSDDSISYRKKMKLIHRYLRKEKAEIASKLRILHELQRTPHKVPVDLFPIFTKFESIDDPKKFLKAARRVRSQIGQRDRVIQGFLYGGRYFNQMMEIFEKKRIPKELTRLPLVESAFNLAARSKVGASGVWQFMRSTGKKFLRIDKAIDERNDPILATWAAAELLQQNYEALNSWPLAITAYNHGREGMVRAVRKLATNNLSDIIKRYHSRTFGFASSNFYSEFLAILELEREFRKYFGKILVDSPIRFEEFPVADDVKFEELALACGVSEQELALLNPALTDWVTSGRGFVPQGYRLKVPPDKLDRCKSGYRNVSIVDPEEVRGARLHGKNIKKTL